MTPEQLFDFASGAFKNGSFHFWHVDSVPFADDLPEGVGLALRERGNVGFQRCILPNLGPRPVPFEMVGHMTTHPHRLERLEALAAHLSGKSA